MKIKLSDIKPIIQYDHRFDLYKVYPCSAYNLKFVVISLYINITDINPKNRNISNL